MEHVSQPSQKAIKQKKFLMILPLLVVPFLTMGFWALGGGKGASATEVTTRKTEGLNMELPVARVESDSNWNKMRFYEQADAEAAKRANDIRNDPYYSLPLTQTDPIDSLGVPLPVNTRALRQQLEPAARKSPYASTEYKDPNEVKVFEQLAKLDKELNKQTSVPHATDRSIDQASGVTSKVNPYSTGIDHDPKAMGESGGASPEEKRLQQMMENLNEMAATPDPDLQEIKSVLGMLMDVQHPERVADKIKQQSAKERGKVFPVATVGNETPVFVLGETVPDPPNQDSLFTRRPVTTGFYSLEDNLQLEEVANSIPAVIHEDQTLVAGATVKLRLTSDVYIHGILIPKDQLVYGTAALSGDRLTITINSVRYKTGLYPVELSVYDLDGLPGVNIPGAITRDVAKQSADQSIQGLGLTSIDPSIGMQAASAGIEVTKNLLSKRVRLIKVTVKAGYRLLLKDTNNK